MKTQQMPLAERIRPQTVDDCLGQEHLLAEGKPLHTIVQGDFLPSLIFWGPPGVGKTTLSRILAEHFQLPFYTISAIDSGVKEVRQIIEMARKQGKIVLFIDEIHRFNKAQQDSLLAAVEKGTIVLIGATTENPSFEVISALLSRCQVYVLEHLTAEDLKKVLDRAINQDVWLQEKKVSLKETEALIRFSGGDARKLLNALELVVQSAKKSPVVITNAVVDDIIQSNMALYDKSGEQHYDIISAFIKSIRGSDPNAAVYWLARMIDGGEDPKFIARRLLILASEDIGNANPTALVLANTCFQAVTTIGYPECRIILSQTAIYLASSRKSNASYVAINDAQRLVKKTGDLSVPISIRNAPTDLMKNLDYGKGYLYAHDHAGNFANMEFLPDDISGKRLYDPGQNPRENEMRKYLSECWKDKYGYDRK